MLGVWWSRVVVMHISGSLVAMGRVSSRSFRGVSVIYCDAGVGLQLTTFIAIAVLESAVSNPCDAETSPLHCPNNPKE